MSLVSTENLIGSELLVNGIHDDGWWKRCSGVVQVGDGFTPTGVAADGSDIDDHGVSVRCTHLEIAGRAGDSGRDHRSEVPE